MDHFVEIAFGCITAINFGIAAKQFDLLMKHVMDRDIHCKLEREKTHE